MSITGSEEEISYFLGIEGEQLGPFSEAEVLEKIQRGQISRESLVWWEGQADWLEISKVETFGNWFKRPIPPPPAPAPNPKPPTRTTPSTKNDYKPDSMATYLPSGKELVPVYSHEESTFTSPPVVSSRLAVIALVIVFLGFVTWGFLRFTTPSNAPIAKPKISNKEQIRIKRKKLLSDASSSLMLSPQNAITSLTELTNQDVTDEVGREAADLLITYYRQNKMYAPAGHLLLKLGKIAEAAKTFGMDPNSASEAESSYFKAFEAHPGKEGANYLMEDIKILLGPLNNRALAINRIELFEKTFPGLIHPFSYYLLPTDQKIKNIFSRFSYTFVESLLAHMAEEFPNLTLMERPIVEIKRDAAGKLRLIGRYKGALALSTDKLSGIYFLYWFIDNQWVLVDTNLTSDRQIFAATTRKKYELNTFTDSQLLDFLEREFKKLHPSQGLHEAPIVNRPATKPAS
ncbi:DUF4339 domain-containing protein [bacterium]|nr:DUF4339 domain-containing protein [bacterium]